MKRNAMGVYVERDARPVKRPNRLKALIGSGAGRGKAAGFASVALILVFSAFVSHFFGDAILDPAPDAAAIPAAAVTSTPFPSRAATAAVSDETAWPRDRNETAPNPASFPPAAQSVAAAQSADTAEETVVWLPKNGKRYHAIPTCSGMNSTRGVSVAEAVLAGYTPCPQCKPPGE